MWWRAVQGPTFVQTAGELEACWRREQPRSRQTWNPSQDREPSATNNGEGTEWKFIVGSLRTVEPGEPLSETWSAPLVMPSQVLVGMFVLKQPYAFVWPLVHLVCLNVLRKPHMSTISLQMFYLVCKSGIQTASTSEVIQAFFLRRKRLRFYWHLDCLSKYQVNWMTD